MYYVALRMLMGDTTKYLALVFGLTFSTTLIVQQGAIFTGILRRAGSSIESVPQAEIWVMHPATRYFDEHKPIPDTALERVRGVPGVEWAERMFLGEGSAQLPDGTYAPLRIIGVERVSKVGLPQWIDSGKPEMLERPDAVFWDNIGLPLYSNIKPGDVLQINDHRAEVAGLVTAPRAFISNPTVYATYERALQYSPGERLRLTFVLVRVKAGCDRKQVAQEIARRTGLGAKTAAEFFWQTVRFYVSNTGIAINFGITVLLGLIVGVAIAGQTFYSFTVENTKHFGTLKAMGTSDATLIKMVLLQAGLVGLLGWGLGAGAASLFGMHITSRSMIAFMLTPQLLWLSLGFTLLTVLLAAVVSIRRVLRIEPAIVFR